jgi:hypothetical protein
MRPGRAISLLNMLGMDHSQRSNAVGSQPAYLPSGDTGRDGGGTYTGQATEPTIQDYENFFGPSARDIKTDLQRYKRHGRWHLPDILQGPNPWLTDRIDGLITDATNSPFTTKILPYRYKEDVDGKIKWNVWSFDEGMASRVPYESAARTLTQSKRSFAGYMVRQGMAIVLEHNFMMTPKGRENFKNQLNQLIGSIQYTNDLDVHMALILAPSYQKTMSERYYSTDKSPSQMCREYADLFGMMQKNVNALDILIEEGKAILRTWGGPMPDFLLCNSKLTFQMTMTPEKTNYITQGIDGVKRLRQGPDLGSYRGLSVIHSRSFAMEVGQHPRDVLRRRVRTAEYYRISPHARNASREFEFYNEERDTWFTLSFQDLLKCARYVHPAGAGDDNAARIDVVYQSLSGARAGEEPHQQLGHAAFMALGAYRKDEGDPANITALIAAARTALVAPACDQPVRGKLNASQVDIRANSGAYQWVASGFSTPMGVAYIYPRDNEAWTEFTAARATPPPANLPETYARNALGVGPMTPRMARGLYSALRNTVLRDPFAPGRTANPGTAGWNAAYLFYLEMIKRKGLPLDLLDFTGFNAVGNPGALANDATAIQDLPFKADASRSQDIALQMLSLHGAVGSVNHPLHLYIPEEAADVPNVLASYQAKQVTAGLLMGSRLILTYEVLRLLLSEYRYRDRIVYGIDAALDHYSAAVDMPADIRDIFQQTQGFAYNMMDSLNLSMMFSPYLVSFLNSFLKQFPVEKTGDPSTICQLGVHTIPMYLSSGSHILHPLSTDDRANSEALMERASGTGGHLNLDMLRLMSRNPAFNRHPFSAPVQQLPARPQNAGGNPIPQDSAKFVGDVLRMLRNRIFEDPMQSMTQNHMAAFVANPARYLFSTSYDGQVLMRYQAQNANIPAVAAIADGRPNLVLDMNEFFDASPQPAPSAEPGPRGTDRLLAQDIEIVVVRPNIEHNMLGVIMGMGGEGLGNTLWGQTELSVYDDSMHGIWGMSYKYHERAIVFNEKNLIRLWDIAYDGYNGGKDDTYVDWTAEDDAPNGPGRFRQHTLDLGNNYRGPSMMVMAFAHDRAVRDPATGRPRIEQLRRNWPSPIVFYDSYNPENARGGGGEALPLDYDNLQTVSVEDFRVFNNSLYYEAYAGYRGMMPDFRTLHVTRKAAGQGSADAETATDCLAFQGSMRVKEGGQLLQTIDGSGHHGPDYTGVASVRAGKGQKTAGVAPTLHRLI